MKIKTIDKLEDWLNSNHWFEDGFVSVANEHFFKIGYLSKGTYIAGEECELIEYKITPKNIIKWNYRDFSFIPSYDNCIRGVDLLNNNFGLCIENIELICEYIEISEPKTIKTYTKPWISNNEIYFTMKTDIPKPIEWIKILKENDLNVCFRCFGGNSLDYQKVPFPNYSGYFLQNTDCLNKTDCGLFFFSVKKGKNENSIHIENKSVESNNIYKKILELSTNWNLIKVNCGNVEFNALEWKTFIKKDKLPERITNKNERTT